MMTVDDFISLIFILWASLSATNQQVGRAGGFHMLRCSGFEVRNYDVTLGHLAYESLRLVQNPGNYRTYLYQLVSTNHFL